jgi:hypothetical protein
MGEISRVYTVDEGGIKRGLSSVNNLIKSIKDKTITAGDIDNIIADFEDHLKDSFGTLENYSHRYLVEELCNAKILDVDDLKAKTREKVYKLMKVFWDLASNNQRINVNPVIIQLLVDAACGRNSTVHIGDKVTIHNTVVIGSATESMLPELKEEP